MPRPIRSTSTSTLVFLALQQFAVKITRRFSSPVRGEPEDQLRGPIENLLEKIGEARNQSVEVKGETRLSGGMGKPDYAVLVDSLLAGYLELKSPGTGARTDRFRRHDAEQWQRFKSLPNILYSDGNEWALYQGGELQRFIRFSGDVTHDSENAITEEDAAQLSSLFLPFLSWEPIVPSTPKELAEQLAPICRLLRDDVSQALTDPNSALVSLRDDWRQHLFPDADDNQFADAYAQTVTYALLLARSENAHTIDIHAAARALTARHTLLARALEILTDEQAAAEISTSLRLIQRVTDRVQPQAFKMSRGRDPWLYFYEDFLAAYDPELRRNAGVYYTPVEVVHAQVRLVDWLLTRKLDRRLGFADDGVVTLDPATGTGTYLLGAFEHALGKVSRLEGPGSVPGRASLLGKNLHGFEIMVGAYSVAELRVTQAIKGNGGVLPEDGLHVYLSDTLESPTSSPSAPRFPTYYAPLAREHARARHVKESVPVLVILGNPPYDRHEAADTENRSRTGGWVRWGDETRHGTRPIFESFTEPVRSSGYGLYLKNIYNLYVYFWRWSIWKVFEHSTSQGPGIISFITASSYLDGRAFIGMREQFRRLCDEIWIIDLGGEGRGGRTSDNIFAIKTPVAIAIAVRYGQTSSTEPAKVHYTRLEGTRDDKLTKLDSIKDFNDLTWNDCPSDWQAPFRPAGTGAYFDWPLLTDVFPWQHSGVETKRPWVISFDRDVLAARWSALLNSDNKPEAFKETRDRKVTGKYPEINRSNKLDPISMLSRSAQTPQIVRYGYRSLDRRWLLADNRLCDYIRPTLWKTLSERQLFMISQFTEPLGIGPVTMATIEMPDRHYFAGRGAKDVVPLWRDSTCAQPNITAGLLEQLSLEYQRTVIAEDLFAYSYGILSFLGFSHRFREELSTRELHLPLTKSSELFIQVKNIGETLIWLHTYGQRFQNSGRGSITGSAQCTHPISNRPESYPETFSYNSDSQVLTVGNGTFAPVSRDVWNFQVSGFPPVQSWLGYRMKEGRGKRSSPLDEIRPAVWAPTLTTELLELLWVVEATLRQQPTQEQLLGKVLAGPLFAAAELPAVTDEQRTVPEDDESEREQLSYHTLVSAEIYNGSVESRSNEPEERRQKNRRNTRSTRRPNTRGGPRKRRPPTRGRPES